MHLIKVCKRINLQTYNSILGECAEGTELVSQILPLSITVTYKFTINYAKIKVISSDRHSSMSRRTMLYNSLKYVILKETHSDRPPAYSLAHNETFY